MDELTQRRARREEERATERWHSFWQSATGRQMSKEFDEFLESGVVYRTAPTGSGSVER